MARITVSVNSQKLSIQEAVSAISDSGCGGQVFFCGTVRSHNKGRQVEGIFYDAHTSLAEKVLSDICESVSSGCSGAVNIYVAHRTGYVAAGDASIIIAVSSEHRADAFKMAREIIEEIKAKVPVWKREHYTDGQSRWLEGSSIREF
ncbi:MAG: molybdenum cofactor biosynthesis protein MoaE [Candidatus Dadabacteria bacterium]|nr:MAG: molybdenum cofactor biosynthesis protein MoaE [Candidatus Dadabacteria bacterium]